jgi:sterol 3beta-glucosyltransferase
MKRKIFMYISIITIGSRGDVQPYIALGSGLQKAGHRVQLVADELYKESIEERNLSFAPIYTNPKKFFDEDIFKTGKNIFRFSKQIRRQYKIIGHRHFREVLDALVNVDVILFSPLASAAFHIAELKKIPCIGAYLQPVTPTKEFGPTFLPELPLLIPFRNLINWQLFRLNNKIYFYLIKDVVNECRKEVLKIAPLPWKVYSNADLSGMPILYGFSNNIIPRPMDWKENIHITGYWFLENKRSWQPPQDLVQFIESGTPPIYFGFGSMIDKEISTVVNIITAVLKRTNQRGIISSGWNESYNFEVSSDVFMVNDVPHEWLFPKMAAVVHHGGAGTTAAGLKAGVPSIVVPFSFDQPFWGNRVFKLGAGPKPIPRKRLTVDNLAKAINLVIKSKRYSMTARRIGEKIQAEDGVCNAVKIIESIVN